MIRDHLKKSTGYVEDFENTFFFNELVCFCLFFFPSDKDVHRNCVIIRYIMDTIILHFAVKKCWRNVPALLSTLIKTYLV